ncbi:hypothetical protein B0H13DRAFT_2318245 [Mycena leptocephala]|nr:hypothetical protein B0H13DRAFT_2318245 [Mycena leptocephala]
MSSLTIPHPRALARTSSSNNARRTAPSGLADSDLASLMPYHAHTLNTTTHTILALLAVAERRARAPRRSRLPTILSITPPPPRVSHDSQKRPCCPILGGTVALAL